MSIMKIVSDFDLKPARFFSSCCSSDMDLIIKQGKKKTLSPSPKSARQVITIYLESAFTTHKW